MAERLSREYGVPVDWQPFLLRPDAPAEGWPLPEAIRAKASLPDHPLTVRAKALGLPLVHRDWVPNSRRALAANELVRELGLDKLDAFHSAVNARYWGRGEDLSQWPVLEAAAADIGVDGAAMREAVEAGALADRVDAGLAAAHRLAVHAVPTYVFFDGDRPVGAIQGAQEYEVFERAAKQLGLSRVPR